MWNIAPEYLNWIREHRQELYPDFPAPRNWPRPAPLWTYNRIPEAGPYDFPAVNFAHFIVSARLRKFFEAEAPGQLSFYPVRVQGPGSEKLPPYYATRFESAWDCLHPYSWDEDENGRFIAYPILDSSKIPVNSLIGAVKHFSVVQLIRDDLKRKIVQEGFTGFHFNAKARFINDGTAPIFEHVNKKRDWPGEHPVNKPEKPRAMKSPTKSKVTKQHGKRKAK
jgi:hypothetical protein